MNPILLSARPLENHNYKIYNTLGIKFQKRLRLSFSHLKEHKTGLSFADTINPFVHVMFLFPSEKISHFFYAAETAPFTATTLLNELNNVGKTVTSLKQNDFLNLILYGDKNFDSNNNQNIMETKTLIAIAIKVYSPQPSKLSDTLNDSTSHFFEQFYKLS